MISAIRPVWLYVAMASAVLLVAPPSMAVMAQGLDADGAIDAIVGSDVSTGEDEAAQDEERIIAAIENTSQSTAEVRRKFTLDRVEIVFLPDLGQGDTNVEAAMEEYNDQIMELRQAVEGSAMFYHAIDSRQILLRDVVAIEFDEDDVVVFVQGERPAGAE